jgi:hypothetical protein
MYDMFGNDDGKEINFMGGGLLSAKSKAKLKQIMNSPQAKAQAKAFIEKRKNMKPAVMPSMMMNRPIMKINRPPTISMMFKGKTDP